jgi:S-adenosyl-L-methionine hydrolase (adenosine-forming)
MNLITLTTDFGTQDWFVGTMKGVILNRCPRAVIVDITHEIPAGDIRAGAFALMASHRFFPKGTVHVAVVDPGVGSARHGIAVQTANYFFVGPDNGVLSFALAKEKIKTIRRLENERLFLRPVSRTFHGRDIFAPVAARLCRGFPIHELGPLQKDFVRLPWHELRMRRQEIEGEVVHIDRFGNLVTNVEEKCLRDVFIERCRLDIGRRRNIRLATHYQAVPGGEAVALVGSSGLLEIAVNGGSAAQQLGLKIGSTFRIRLN